MVQGAVIAGPTIVQPLTDYIRLGVHPSDNIQLYRVARVLVALRNSLNSLQRFYNQATPPLHLAPPNLGRFFPYVLSYPAGGKKIKFEYIVKLAGESATKPIFKARTAEGELIVVKFVQQYNAAAHRLLAERGLAPPLLYSGTDDGQTHGNIGGLKMVVMKFIEGKTAYEAYNDSHVLPESIFQQVENSIGALHEAGLVFGDLRPPNIMIEGDSQKALLIDFDWCGDENKGRYSPAHNDMSGAIEWHEDVKRGGVMKKEHDLFMLENLRPLRS